ncbi:MAG: DUF58 domain-containing protein [Gammaproteobacteria bacterium]|nr:DUF58 domain-containing protein [Gammaproteobacteria bacterium]
MSFSLTSLPHWFHRRLNIDRRARSRLEPVTLAQSRIFILPTRNGMALLMLLLGMVVAATNFDSSELFLLIFMLLGTFLVTMVHTYRNLAGLRFHPGHEEQVFSGEPAVHSLQVENPFRTPRKAVAFELGEGTEQVYDIPADDKTLIKLREGTRKRGRHDMPALTISTRYPMGWFRAWSHVRLIGSCLVYPRPSIDPPAPSAARGRPSEDQGEVAQAGQDDFNGHRRYQITDSPRHVDWKAEARGRERLTKLFASHEQEELWLDWHQLQGLDTETRLSHLCRWVLDAESGSRSYGLALPGLTLEPARGDAHKHRCLKALALYGEA